MKNLEWIYDQKDIDWNDLAHLYRIAPLGVKDPEILRMTFTNSMFKCFIFDDRKIIAAGRALADGADCSYLCDIAIHPDYQGLGIGKKLVKKLIEMSEGHKKIILYSNPGKEAFYQKLGFRRMKTAMAIFENERDMILNGTLSD